MSQKALLLKSVRDEIKAKVTALQNRVYVVVESPQGGPLLPAEAETPFVTVSDAGITFVPTAGRIAEAQYAVTIRIYVQSLRDCETPVVGHAGSAESGVAALQDTILDYLQYNLMTARITGVEQALPVRCGPVDYTGDDTWFAVVGDLGMVYTMLEDGS